MLHKDNSIPKVFVLGYVSEGIQSASERLFFWDFWGYVGKMILETKASSACYEDLP